jgi:hypothetical protein
LVFGTALLRLRIVLFVSSREMRLCSVSRFSSTSFLLHPAVHTAQLPMPTT